MKKIFAILLTLFLMAGVLCITAFAADEQIDNEPSASTLIRVSALKKDGSTEFIKDYDRVEDGWTAAIDLAEDEDEMNEKGYDRVVIDLYSDWNKNEYGKFDPIHFPDGVRVTFNINDNVIDAERSSAILNGEVIYIGNGADVIINDGTITGGCSNNGAGGIHIKGDARVTLNNVNVVGNYAKDDDGGGIAVYDGAVLTVNGGIFENNTVDGNMKGYSYTLPELRGGAVYICDAIATFNGVEFKNNNAPQLIDYGAAIYADGSKVTIDKCIFNGNGSADDLSGDYEDAMAIVHGVDSTITVKESTFTGNIGTTDENMSNTNNVIFVVDDSQLIIEASEFSNNASAFIIRDCDESLICVTGTKFQNNPSSIMDGDSKTSSDSYFRECTFDNNGSINNDFCDITTTLTFYDCSMGDSTYEDDKYLKFVATADTEDPADKPAEGVVLRISGLKRDGSTVPIKDYRNLVYGWESVLEFIDDGDVIKDNDYVRIVVDIYADWIAVEGDLYDSGAICIPEDAKMTINLNGHTINRGLTEDESDGEVIYVDDDADVIINDGTITGGYSDNGAGGIHIKDGAKVTLNNVHVDGNRTKGDDGPGIAIYGGELIMNGGSVSNNYAYEGVLESYGALYIDDATATLNNVTISGNDSCHAGIMYVVDSTITLTNCIIENNGKNAEFTLRHSLFLINDGELNIIGGEIRNNGMEDISLVDMFEFKNDVRLNMSDGCKVTGNLISYMFLQTYYSETYCYVTDCVFTDNVAKLSGYSYEHDEDTITIIYNNCKFNNNKGSLADGSVFYGESGIDLRLVDCDLGNSTFGNKKHIHIGNSGNVASIFGEGSIPVIIALAALLVAGGAIWMNIASRKKNEDTAPEVEKTEEEAEQE